MARHGKRQPPRQKRVCQASPFLNLPGEIRTLIYRAALVSPTPIDLWPHKFVEKPEEDTALASRIAKLRKQDKLSDTDVPAFRQQVRSHIARELTLSPIMLPADSQNRIICST
jgi:hypothetical protein